MDIGAVMNAMRDPAGVPAHPLLFQALMVATWILHVAFVNLTLGAAGLAIYGYHHRHVHHWQRLTLALMMIAKVGVSLLIVLGVAPLLFTQVIYDPQWYASNVLSAVWALSFIITLIIAYSLWFFFYYVSHHELKPHMGGYAWLALLLFCLDGLIMHALAYQSLLPAAWMDWYAPGGIIDTSGSSLHAIQWPRYVFIMSLSVPVVGIFLLAYEHYFSVRIDFSPEYRQFVWHLGQKLALWGFAIAAVLFLGWQLVLPSATDLVMHPIGWLLFMAMVAMVWWAWYFDPVLSGYWPMLGGLGVLALLAIWREVIRVHYLAPFGYSITDYPVHMDWPSMLLFFSTITGVGGLVGGFYLTLLYRAGQASGKYTADALVDRLGTGAIAVLGLWIVVFFVYGITIWLGNSFIA